MEAHNLLCLKDSIIKLAARIYVYIYIYIYIQLQHEKAEMIYIFI